MDRRGQVTDVVGTPEAVEHDSEFSTYLAILLLLVSVIFVIDLTSEAIRHRLILSQDREP